MTKKDLLTAYDANMCLFIADHKAAGTSETTVVNYSRRLAYFRDFLERYAFCAEISGIDTAVIRAYRDDLSGHDLKTGTVRQYLVELKAFFEAVIDPALGYSPITPAIEGRRINPVSARLVPKIPQADRQYDKLLSEGDIEKLWENKCPGGNPSISATWARNYAIVVLLLDSKIRNSELLDLRLEDVDFCRGELIIRRGKGNKARFVSLTEISLTALKLYLASGLRPKEIEGSDFLFGTEAVKGVRPGEGGGNTRKGAAWHKGTSQWLSQLVERHVYNITGKHGFRTHSLRHAGAALDLNSGARLERIQAELGHASVRTTEIYTDRLKSVSRTLESKEAIKTRDEWAEINREKYRRLMAVA